MHGLLRGGGMSEDMRSYWDTRAITYGGLEWVHDDEWLRTLREMPSLPAGGKLLDAGCGNGVAGSLFADRYEVTGLDISRDMTRSCPFPVIIADITEPYISHAMKPGGMDRYLPTDIDVVVARMLLHNLNGWQFWPAIRNLAYMLKPGGRLLISEGIAPPGAEDWFEEMMSIKEERISFTPANLIGDVLALRTLGAPVDMRIGRSEGHSIRNWLQGADPGVRDRIWQLHLDMPNPIAKAYNRHITKDDILVDFWFCHLVVTRR
jgi:SAM-dependent methyltransferase